MLRIIYLIFLFYICLYSSSIFSNICFNVENFHWGKVEIVSMDKRINRIALLEDFPVKVNKVVTKNNLNDPFFWCEEKINQKVLPELTDCNFIHDEINGNIYFVINTSVVHNVNQNISDKTLSTVFLDRKLIKLRYNFDKLFCSLFGTKRDITQVISKDKVNSYHIKFNDPELALEANKLYMLVSPHKKHILNVIRNDKDEEERAHAARLLNWVGLTEADLATLVEQYPDNSDDVNDKLIDIFNSFSFLVPKKCEEDLFIKSVKLIQIDDLELCAKDLKMIETLLNRNKNLTKHFSDNTRNVIRYLATNSVIPSVYGPAKVINDQFLYS